ncbi:MAG: N-acyl-L-amino acid amidohydrolase [Flavobacteriales bacterium]|nr:N-acyl-L-amino acid amidohydrolase [Flavobacteriales bacterium]|tara:strand:- start:17166 stop:18335 length:1170 start_codon:yes stop_codon:yes gene_type:complete
MINKIKKLADNIFDDIVEIRRHIHKNPELSFKEHETSNYIKSVLTRWNIAFTDNIADTGIVVLLHGRNADSKILALRADFDALPIIEENNVEYCSQNKGVMHACGHDAHTACLLGTLRILDILKKEWKGTIKFIFQPAEEKYPGGAQQMIEEGVLENPKVQNMFGQHVFPDLEVGKVGFSSGNYMASADEIQITVIGTGGHAALPEKYNSPIIAAAKLITSLDEYFLPYRSIPSVFAIGFVEAKGYCNVIPDSVKLKGTFRTINEKFRSSAHTQMQEIASSIAKEYSLDVNFNILKGYPSLYNNEELTHRAIIYAKEYMGVNNVVNLSQRMTAEDFAYFSRKVPSCFYRLGSANISKGIVHGLHTNRFDIDENCLKIGMGLMAYLAIKS